jgi:uracil-DNA glycosylase
MEFRTDHPMGNLLGWWELAGVDAPVADEPASWLARPAPPPSASTRREIADVIPARGEMPATLPEFLAWLKSSPDVPEAAWTGDRIIPDDRILANIEARPIMLISDMPDMEDMQAASLFSGAAGRLLDAMLRAIGLSRESLYLCSLASTRPPGGLFDPKSAERLARIMRRHVSLVAPTHVLLLGDKTSRALLAADAGGGRGSLQMLNHDGGNVDTIATFHPRLLLKQPAAKAECWKDLQLFARGFAN